MFLGKIQFEFDLNDRFLLRLAAELLEQNADKVLSNPEQQQWTRERAQYFQRLFKER